MQCTKCGSESMIINDLRYCSGCVKPFDDCSCAPSATK